MWAQIIGSLIGQFRQAGQDAKADSMLQETMRRLKAIGRPDLQKEVAQEVGKTEAGQADPALQAAQQQALGRLGQWGSGQLTPEDKAQLSLMEDEAARRGQIQQNAIVNRAQQVGQLGGGAQLAMQQQAAQGQTQAAYGAALQNMISARNRAMQATQQQGQLAGQMSQADYQRKAARDAMARYNANARANTNRYNSGLAQQDWNNQIRMEGLLSGREDLMGAAMRQKGANEANMLSNLGAGVSKASEGQGGGNDDPYKKYKDSGYTDSGAGDMHDADFSEDWKPL